MRHALSEAGFPADGKVRLRGQPGGLADLLGGGDDAARAFAERAAREVDPLEKLLGKLPLEARAWVRAMAPLGEREKVVASIAFVVMGTGPR